MLNDITDTTGDVFFGLGLQCARCHDHKFDPILQKDYFRLQAFFAALRCRAMIWPSPRPPNEPRYADGWRTGKPRPAELRQKLGELEAPYRQQAAEAAINKFPGRDSGDDPQARRGAIAARTAIGRACLSPGDCTNSIGSIAISRANRRNRSSRCARQLAEFDSQRPAPLAAVMAATDVGASRAARDDSQEGRRSPSSPAFSRCCEEGPAEITPLATCPTRPAAARRCALAHRGPTTRSRPA